MFFLANEQRQATKNPTITLVILVNLLHNATVWSNVSLIHDHLARLAGSQRARVHT